MPPGDKTQNEKESRLITEIDLRLQSSEAWDYLQDAKLNHKQVEKIASLMRMCYGMGYNSALIEPVRGQLYKDLGQPVPKKGKKCP